MTSRVNRSPAISNNTQELRRARKNRLLRAKGDMREAENAYAKKKAIMEFNVAKRPLLVEQ